MFAVAFVFAHTYLHPAKIKPNQIAAPKIRTSIAGLYNEYNIRSVLNAAALNAMRVEVWKS